MSGDGDCRLIGSEFKLDGENHTFEAKLGKTVTLSL